MSARIVSRETPSQDVPSFDHRVTQCKSAVMVSLGKSRNDFQSQRRKTRVPSSIVNSQRSSATCGVGPADRTGKSVVRYCPGGSFAFSALRRPEKPLETISSRTSPYRVKYRAVRSEPTLPLEGSSEMVCTSKISSARIDEGSTTITKRRTESRPLKQALFSGESRQGDALRPWPRSSVTI